MNNLKGKLLIAHPYLPDPNFFRTVVLIMEHGQEGAEGVVLNRAANMPIQEVWKDAYGEESEIKGMIHTGGPVFCAPFALHKKKRLKDKELVAKVYATINKEKLEKLLKVYKPEDMRVFVGCCGWQSGQLESELRTGSWYVESADAADVFYEYGENPWKNLIQGVGREQMKIITNIEDDEFYNKAEWN